MSGTSDRSARVNGTPHNERSVLVVDERAAGSAQITRVPTDGPLVTVGFTRADVRRAAVAGSERTACFVDATPSEPSGSERPIDDADPAAGDVHTESVGSPNDLTGVGVAIERCCATVAGTDTAPTCWVPSLTALLQYVDERRGYRFCNAVVSRMASLDGDARFRLRGRAHDTQTVETFASLADAVVERPHEEARRS